MRMGQVIVLAAVLAACHPNKDAAEGKSGDQSGPAAGSSAPAAQSGAAASGDRANRPQAVTTVLSRVESVPVVLFAQGNVLSLDEVDIRPQKTGAIAQIHFREGQDVAKGQLLFSLDDREDTANLKKAEATLDGTQAQIVIAQRELERNTDLFNQRFVSSAVLDTSKSKLETLQSTLEQNKAAVEQARVVLSYSKIRAPFDGRAGRIDVRPGSLVLANTTISLVKITRMNPIGVSFTLAERDLQRLRAAQTKGNADVQVEVPGQRDDTVKGKVVFIETTVDKISGTIGVKAEVNNAERKLWPGQYVTVRTNVGEIADAIVLPPQAIVNGPNNRFVYVVKDDMTVAQQPIDLVRIAGRNAIVKGIDAGMKVVVEGAANLRPGGKVFEAPANGGDRGGRGNGGGRRGGGDQSSPAAEQKTDGKGDVARPARSNTSAEQASGKKAGDKTAVKTGGKPAGKGVALPEGFTPRDPERWASLSDEEKLKVIERWRERQPGK